MREARALACNLQGCSPGESSSLNHFVWTFRVTGRATGLPHALRALLQRNNFSLDGCKTKHQRQNLMHNMRLPLITAP